MAISKILRKPSLFTRLLSDEGLTKKAYLNALTLVLEYVAKLLVSFITIPLMVSVLGNYNYGLWQILNRIMGYLSSTSGKPTQALKWILANQQASNEYEIKRRSVGSTVMTWALFLPVLGITGGIISWFLPFWLKIPMNYYWELRITAGICVLTLIFMNFANLPNSVLQGENLGYKRMGLSALLTIIGGVGTWMALMLGTGMIGVATAVLVTTILSGISYYLVVRKFAPWFGVVKPPSDGMRKFLGISGWFLAWDLLFNVMSASDVVVLGFLKSIESVTSYTLTKYAPETIINVVAIMVFGVIPGLGGIIGSGDLKKASQVRGEIMILSWLVLTIMGGAIILLNPIFLQLWVGTGQYAGTLPNLLIVIVVIQFALIQNDATIINLSLEIQWKVLIGALSVVLSLMTASIMIGYFNLGIIGLCLGLLLGRAILSIGYPILVGRYLNIPLASQLKGTIRPALVMGALFFVLTLFSDDLAYAFKLSGVIGWLAFFVTACLTAIILLIILFYTGLSVYQRQGILKRIRAILIST